jgi:hypothetical protein
VAVAPKLIAMKKLSCVIVDSTPQEKAITHPTNSKSTETTRFKVM